MDRSLIQPFLGKTVQVKLEGLTVRGVLSSCFSWNDTDILVLLNENRFTLLKGLVESVGVVRNESH